VEFTGGGELQRRDYPHVTFRLLSAEMTISFFVDRADSQLSRNSQRRLLVEMDFPLFSLHRHKFLAKQDAARVVRKRHCPEAGGLEHQLTLASATARPTPPALAHHQQPRRNVPIFIFYYYYDLFFFLL
jgi:hypothetical protein